MCSGIDPAMPWLRCERLLGGCGGKSLKEQRRALRTLADGPIRQGVVEGPWERLVGIVGSRQRCGVARWEPGRSRRRW